MIGTCSFLLIMDGLSGIFNKMKQSMVEKIPQSRTPTDPSKSSPKHEDYPYLPKELFASQPTGDRPSKPNPHNPTPPRIYYPEPRVPNYDGKFDFMDFQAQFECLAEDYEWSYEEMGSQLCRCLTGEARSVLSMLDRPSRRDYLALCEALKGLHTTPGSEAVWRLELHRTVRAAGQDPNKFGRELRRLAMRAYPDGDLPELALVTIFIQGLGDSAIGKHVFLKEPQTLQEAIRHACMFEAYNRSTKGSRAVNSVKVTPPISGDEHSGPIKATAPQEDFVRDAHSSADPVHPEIPPSPSPANVPASHSTHTQPHSQNSQIKTHSPSESPNNRPYPEEVNSLNRPLNYYRAGPNTSCSSQKSYNRPNTVVAEKVGTPHSKVERVNVTVGDACWFLQAPVMGHMVEWLLDCGANASLLSDQIYHQLPQPPPLQPVQAIPVAANGETLKTIGQTVVSIQLGDVSCQVPVIVADIGATPGILGMNFLCNADCKISFREGILTCGQQDFHLTRSQSEDRSQVHLLKTVSLPTGHSRLVPNQVVVSHNKATPKPSEGSLEPQQSAVSQAQISVSSGVAEIDADVPQQTKGSLPLVPSPILPQQNSSVTQTKGHVQRFSHPLCGREPPVWHDCEVSGTVHANPRSRGRDATRLVHGRSPHLVGHGKGVGAQVSCARIQNIPAMLIA